MAVIDYSNNSINVFIQDLTDFLKTEDFTRLVEQGAIQLDTSESKAQIYLKRTIGTGVVYTDYTFAFNLYVTPMKLDSEIPVIISNLSMVLNKYFMEVLTIGKVVTVTTNYYKIDNRLEIEITVTLPNDYSNKDL